MDGFKHDRTLQKKTQVPECPSEPIDDAPEWRLRHFVYCIEGALGTSFSVKKELEQPQIILLKEGTDTSEGKPWLTRMHVLQ
ncbi:unnamed protein product [Sphagnum jensenii]